MCVYNVGLCHVLSCRCIDQLNTIRFFFTLPVISEESVCANAQADQWE